MITTIEIAKLSDIKFWTTTCVETAMNAVCCLNPRVSLWSFTCFETKVLHKL